MAQEINLSDIDSLISETNHVSADPEVTLAINKYISKTLDKYVPFESGKLSKSVLVTSDSLIYQAKGKDGVDYAHYVYEGEVYGTNIPITQNGQLIGFYSPKGQKKYPKGQQMEYGLPLARDHWDKALDDNPHEMKKVNKYAKGMILRKLLKGVAHKVK